MSSTKLSLRILYTINSSPQYILARSPSAVPVVLVPPQQNTSHYDRNAPQVSSSSASQPRYATASLKTCLDTICRSSPELVQDSTRDFSVYVLDPLESDSAPAPVHIPNSNTPSPSHQTQQSRGVAVGLGLMSWALLADECDGATVNGTLIKLLTGHEALEVIFALRETAAMLKDSLPEALRSWGLPPEPHSKRSRAQAFKLNRDSKHLLKSSESGTSSVAHSLPPSSGTGHIALRPMGPPIHPPKTSSTVYFKRNDKPTTDVTTSSTVQPSISNAIVPHSSFHVPHISTDPSTLETLASIHMRSKSKQKRFPKLKAAPTTESERLLDVPETYIGPRKKKGRKPKVFEKDTESTEPVASGSGSHINADTSPEESDVVDEDATATDLIENLDDRGNMAGASSSATQSHLKPGRRSSSDSAKHPSSSPSPPIKHPPDSDTIPTTSQPTPQELLSIISLLSGTPSQEANAHNIALLTALSSIDSTADTSTSMTEKNSALINALQQLLSAFVRQPLSRPAEISQPHAHPDTHHQNSSYSHDDDIILLEKENVNPTAFRRRAERDRENIKSSGPGTPIISSRLGAPFKEVSQVSGYVLSHHSERINQPHNTHPFSDDHSSSTSRTGTSAGTSTPRKRKRTLSDIMDDREYDRSKLKARDRERAERRDAYRHTQSHSKKNSDTGKRLKFATVDQNKYLYDETPTSASRYKSGIEPWTSPARPNHRGSNQSLQETDNARENSWLRPITVLDSPKLPKVSASSPIRQTSQTRRRYVVPNWARTDTAMLPRLSEEAQRALKEAEDRKKEEKKQEKLRSSTSRSKDKRKRGGRSVSTESGTMKKSTSSTSLALSTQPAPISASSECPVFAAPTTSLGIFASFSGSRSPSRSPPPSTPPQKPRVEKCSPVEGEASSLFTPTPKAWSVGTHSALYSPIYSPQVSLGTSVTPPGRGRKMDLRQVAVTDEGIVNDCKDELRETFQDLDDPDLPSSSLPIASSDYHVHDSASGADSLEDSEILPAMKQHWSGLPPSSPPAPTSPPLLPHDAYVDAEDEEMDYLELSLTPASDDGLTSDPSNTEHLTYSEQDPALLPDPLEATSTLYPAESPANSLEFLSSEMDIFDQFTNHNMHSDGAASDGDGGLDPTFQTSLADLDFTEFWQTFEPLIQDHTSNFDSGPVTDLAVDSQGISDTGNLDHASLAADVQALFSGCLM